MATTPSTENYQLGKGVGYFAIQDPTTGIHHGERDLGNIPALTSNVSIEFLTHYSSRSGLRKRDLNKPVEITPTLSATLDEITPDNQVLSALGTLSSVTQDAGYLDDSFVAELGLRTILGKRHIGLYHLKYKASAAPALFVEDEIVTAAGGATGEVIAVVGDANAGTLVIMHTNTTSFIADEAITGSIAGDALVDTPESFQAGLINIKDSGDTTTYVANTDYQVNTSLKDDKVGRFLVLPGSSIGDGDTVNIRANYAATTYELISFFTNIDVEGRFRFVSDNAIGPNAEFVAHRASITPQGDRAYIGDALTEISIQFELLADDNNHPDSPYIDMIIEG